MIRCKLKSSDIDANMDWDVWRASLENITGIDKEEKTQAKQAIRYIESVIGSALEGNHPILQRIYQNQAPWAIRWLIEVANAIQLISTKKGGSLIIKKFKQTQTLNESLFQVYVAKVLLEGNYEIEFIEESSDKKTPDIRITNLKTGNDLYLELTEIDKSSQEKQNEESYWEIAEVLNFDSMGNIQTKLYYRGFIRRYLSNVVRKSVISKIQNKIREANEVGFSSLKIAGKLELVIANDANYTKLETWDKEKNISHKDTTESKFSRLEIPDPQPDKPFRIGNKIRKKRFQFNKLKPNALVIKFDDLFDKKDIKKIKSLIEDLEQYVYDFNDLDLLVIVDNQVGGFYKDTVYSRNNNLFIIQNKFPIQKRILIIVNNHSAKKLEATSFSTGIKKAFQISNTLLF